jgi:hypothetical protein
MADNRFARTLFAFALPPLFLAACATEPASPAQPTPPPGDESPQPPPGGEGPGEGQPGDGQPGDANWVPVFADGLEGWTPRIRNAAPGEDPGGIFRVEDGVLHVLEVPASARDLGYLRSEASYSHFRLRFEYAWGEADFSGPDEGRISGVFYLADDAGGNWPRSAELDIQEGVTGDLWLLDGVSVDTTVEDASATPLVYSAGGEAVTTPPGNFVQVVRSATLQNDDGWTRVELVVTPDEIVHLVEGQEVVRASNPTLNGAPRTEGFIAFQARNTGVRYRNVELLVVED